MKLRANAFLVGVNILLSVLIWALVAFFVFEIKWLNYVGDYLLAGRHVSYEAYLLENDQPLDLLPNLIVGPVYAAGCYIALRHSTKAETRANTNAFWSAINKVIYLLVLTQIISSTWVSAASSPTKILLIAFTFSVTSMVILARVSRKSGTGSPTL